MLRIISVKKEFTQMRWFARISRQVIIRVLMYRNLPCKDSGGAKVGEEVAAHGEPNQKRWQYGRVR